MPSPATSTAVVDVVAVLNQETFVQVFPFARPVKASVRETSKTMIHPAENGIIIGDHRVIEPTEIDLPLVITSANYSSYRQLENLFQQGTLLIVQTRVKIYSNIIIENLPHEESPEMFDAIAVGCRMKEILYFPTPETYNPADPENQDTQNSGQQQPGVPNAPPAGFSAAWFDIS